MRGRAHRTQLEATLRAFLTLSLPEDARRWPSSSTAFGTWVNLRVIAELMLLRVHVVLQSMRQQALSWQNLDGESK